MATDQGVPLTFFEFPRRTEHGSPNGNLVQMRFFGFFVFLDIGSTPKIGETEKSYSLPKSRNLLGRDARLKPALVGVTLRYFSHNIYVMGLLFFVPANATAE